jgi:acetyltransferase-like isoleucine patch superfamily enzyme
MNIIKSLKKVRNELLRTVKYRRYTIGKGFYSGIRVRLWAKSKLIIGENFYIGRDAFIEGNAVIGDNVMIGNRAAIIGKYDHCYQTVGTPIRFAVQMRDADYDWKGIDLLTIIENDVMVGHSSTILGGVKISEGSIIGATSLVTKDVEPYSIYMGSPAKKIRDRFDTVEDLHRHLELVKSKYRGIL